VSTDAGITWFTFNEGFPEAVLISDLNLSTGSRALRAITHGNGVYERDPFVPATGFPPIVSDIPDQTVGTGERFAPIRADSYVADPDNPDPDITWSWAGNSSLVVRWVPANRRIRIRAPNGWTGTETITFIATDPNGLNDSDDATFTVSSPLRTGTGATGIASSGLLGNSPNPFNPTTSIRYALRGDSYVVLSVYDLAGREVMTLVDGAQAPGLHSILWDGRSRDGNAVASGVYVYRIHARPIAGSPEREFIEAKRMLFIK
jgi:hypothetical protein